VAGHWASGNDERYALPLAREAYRACCPETGQGEADGDPDGFDWNVPQSASFVELEEVEASRVASGRRTAARAGQGTGEEDERWDLLAHRHVSLSS